MEKTRLDRIKVNQIADHKIWKYTPPDSDDGAVHVKPDNTKRPRSLKNRVVATEVKLADGSRLQALIENIHVDNPEFTKHWLIAHFRIRSRWWRLARYHDWDAEKHSPIELARRLGKQLEDIFPITYDLSDFCSTNSSALKGLITAQPETRLTRANVIGLAVPKK